MKRKSLLIMLLAALFMPLALHAQQSLPYEYGFENQNLSTDGWTTSNLESGSQIMQMGGSYGYVFGFKWTTNPPQYLISPELTGTGNGVYVSFIYSCYMSSYPETFQVGYSTTTNATNAFTWDTEVTVTNVYSDQFLTYEKQFPAGTKYVAIKCTSNDMYYLFVDMISFTVPDACAKPTNLTVNEVGSRTANISWASDASSWQVCINDDEAHLINVNQTSYTLSGLTPETNYTVKVRANCGNNNLSAWASVSFTTEVACPAPGDLTATNITSTSANIGWTSSNNNFVLKYREFFENPNNNNFENGMGSWTTIDADGDTYTWMLGSECGGTYLVEGASLAGSGYNESDDFAVSGSYSNVYGALYPDNYLVSPRITLGGSISFWACPQDAGYAAEVFGVAVSTTNNTDASAFTTIQQWTMSAKSGNRAQGNWHHYTVDLSAFSGQGYVAIRHFNCTYQFMLDVDDITISEPGVGTSWNTINNATNPQALTGLTPETLYEVQVQSVCGGQDGSSEWAYTTFTTLPSCVAPARLTISNITTNSAVVNWTGSASSYNLKVNDQVYNNVTSPYTLSGLTPNTEYTVEVQSVCSATSTSTWSTVIFWTTCEAFNLPYSYNFDDANELNCWGMVTANTANPFGISALDDNNVFVFSSYYSASSYDQYLISPELNGTTGIGIDVEFKYRTLNGNGSGETFKVGYSTTTNDISAFTWGDEISTVSTDWIDYLGEFPAGTKYVAIYYYADYQYYFLVDDFNFDVHSNCRKPTDLHTTEVTANSVTLSWTENGEATEWVVWYSSGARPTQVPATETTLTINVNPETSYIVRVRPVCDVNDKWSDDLAFTTPSTCPLPSDITVETEPESATLSWTGSNSVNSYNVRYCVPIHGATLLEEGFENGLGNWTTIDADGDGNNWFLLSELTTLYTYYTQTPEWQHVGNDAILSGSYINGVGELDADNWLITPQVTLGGMATFYARSIMADYPEQISVYVSTNSTNVEDFVLLNTWTPGAEWTQYMVDLSAYAGQGYIAIRNQGYDQYIVSIDDFVVEAPAQQNWIATLSTSENSITITGLQMSTTYAYQIQSACNTGVWTALDFFTTLGGNVFITDGNWGDGNDWSGGVTPEEGSNVIIKANVTIPAGYTAIADQITIDGGSITIADGGQLQHNTDDLEVTMEKTVEPYTDANSTNNYKLLSFPFSNYPDVPEGMITTTGTDFYRFSNSAVDEEWQNNQVSAISFVYAGPGYLYANPEGLDLSMTGTTYASYDTYLSMPINYDENENGDNSGWRLIGNPFTCNAYIYGETADDFFPMDVMYYDENGDMQTISAGPVAPMQGFFVKVSDTTTVYFVTYELELEEEAKSLPSKTQAISLDKKMHKTAAQAISFDKIEYKNVTVLDKKAEKPLIVLDKTMVKKLAKKDAYAPFKNVIQFKPIKK